MRRHFSLLSMPTLAGLVASLLVPACADTRAQDVTPTVADVPRPTGGSSWAGGGGAWAGGGSQWGGGGSLWAGGGSWWAGGGGAWAGGGGAWAGGGGQWAGGGSYWAGGGSWWAGGGSTWGGGGGMWAGGFASTFPFVGWSSSRHWNFRGVPKVGYSPASPSTFSVAKDTTVCPAGQVRLGGFAYSIDVESWPGVAALGYNSKLCIPTPDGTANTGLAMNATVGDSSLTKAGGYALKPDLSNAGNDVYAMKSMIGYGTGNVATQYGGALCASYGSLAAAKRSCGVGIAFSDPNFAKDGTTLTPRGVTMNAAQAGSFTSRTPFGRDRGYSQYGAAPNDMESYANQALRRHTTRSVPTSPGGIDAWNNDPNNYSPTPESPFNYRGSDFAPITLAAESNPSKLQADAVRSLGYTTSPQTNHLDMIPVDTAGVLASDMANSISMTGGDLYALSLHSLAMQQSPLYGSGGGRWFFHDPSDPNGANLPLMDLSSIFQGSTYVLTGQLSGLPSSTTTLNKGHISALTPRYADWRPEPAGALYIDRAGQFPATVATDNDKAARLDAALGLERPLPNIGGGAYSTCAIASAGGALKCWGSNVAGELGTGSAFSYNTPTDVPGLTSGVTSISAGSYHSCAITAGGALSCWGRNGFGQLGDNTVFDRHQSTAAVGLASGTAMVSSRFSHSCAVTTTGTVKCWGQNAEGEGGLDPAVYGESHTPRDIQSTGYSFTSVETGQWFTCALTTTKEVLCWGLNGSGQLGQGTTSSSRSTPTKVPGLGSVVEIALGGAHACARTTSGAVLCWGSNYDGQLGDGTGTRRLAPVTIIASGATALRAGANHTCAVVGGTAKCWGKNTFGELGDGTSLNRLAPVNVSGLGSGVADLSIGLSTGCAVVSGGIKCWGGTPTNIGSLGNGTNGTSLVPVSVTLPGGTTADQVRVGHEHVCARTTSNGGASYGMKCWGYNGYGQLGVNMDSSTPVAVSGLESGAIAVAGGTTFTCALTSTGAVKCWGNNTLGQLGTGTHNHSSVPVTVSGLSSGVTAIAAGHAHACAVTSAGGVKCWGLGTYGQLGNGTTSSLQTDDDVDTYSATPLDVVGLSNVVAITAGDHHTCALTAAGAVKCWGSNNWGEGGLGDGTTIDRASPVGVVSLGSGVKQIAAKGQHTCALTRAGGMKCWGSNWRGEVGDGTWTARLVPVDIPGLTSGVVSMGMGGTHGCAVLAGGSLKCWGEGWTGAVGNGSTDHPLSPVSVTVAAPVLAVEAGEMHTCARLSTGQMQCWGLNVYGQVGDASWTTRYAPVALPASVSNGGLMASQGSVLIDRSAATGSDPVAGHIMPIPWSMVKTSTNTADATNGSQFLIVTYNPLAAAAAMFIEQYDAHIAACNNTTSEAMTEADQQNGTKLWACSNATGKSNYLAGMQTFLNGARHYLFGRDDGCIQSTQTVAGVACPTTLIDNTQANLPYTFVVPDYTSSAYNATYYASLSNALTTYRSNMMASSATRLERTLQLAGIKKFGTNNAIVTSRTTRPGDYQTGTSGTAIDCIQNDGFTFQ